LFARGEIHSVSMDWIRSHIRAYVCLALFALALQAVLSFGHIHPEDLGLAPIGAGHTQISANTPSAPENQSAPDQNPGTDDYCAICASMMLVATAVPALPPVLIIPEKIHLIWPAEAPARSISSKFIPSFQARGPPNA
jgi:hypothetical protein